MPVVVAVGCGCSITAVRPELNGEDFVVVVEVPLMSLVVIAGGAAVVIFVRRVSTVDIDTKVLFPTIPSHITWHELSTERHWRIITKPEVVFKDVERIRVHSIPLLGEGSQKIDCLDISVESLHLKSHLANAVQNREDEVNSRSSGERYSIPLQGRADSSREMRTAWKNRHSQIALFWQVRERFP